MGKHKHTILIIDDDNSFSNPHKTVTNQRGKMSKIQRLIEMFRLLEKEPGKWTQGMLSQKFQVSKMQISRDITALDEMGFIKKSGKTTISINEKKKV